MQLEELRRTRRALEERMLAFERTAEDEQWQQEIATGVKALFSRVDVLEASLGQYSDRDDAAYLGELRDAVVQLAQRVETVTPELESLRERVEGTASVAALQYGLSEIAERIDDLRPELERTEARADAVNARLEEVAAGLGSAIDEHRRTLQLSSAVQDELAARIDRAVTLEAIDALQVTVDETRRSLADLAQRPSGDPDLAARVEGIAAELAGRADEAELTSLSATVAELTERLELGAGVAAAEGEPDPRVDALITRVAELAARPAGDPALEARLEATERAVATIAAELERRHAVGPALEALEARLEETAHRVDAVAAEVAGRADAAGQAEGCRGWWSSSPSGRPSTCDRRAPRRAGRAVGGAFDPAGARRDSRRPRRRVG